MTGRGAARAAARTGSLVAALGRALTQRVDGPPRARALALADLLARMAARHGMVVESTGPLPPPGAVLVANHVSYLDPVALLPLAPAVPIAKAQVGRWPLIGGAARSLGVVLVDRESPASRVRALRGAIRALVAGARVLNFPEGTTTAGGELAPFHRGIFGAARIAGAPVVPVALAFDPPELAWIGDAAFLPHYARTASLAEFTCHVRWGDPIDPAAASAAGLALIARDRIHHLLGRIHHHEPGDRVRLPSPRPEQFLPAAAG